MNTHTKIAAALIATVLACFVCVALAGFGYRYYQSDIYPVYIVTNTPTITKTPTRTITPTPTITQSPTITPTPGPGTEYPTSTPAPVSTNDETDLRAEYYRGAYDVCEYFYENTGGDPSQTIATCNKFTQRLRDSGWYDVESKGYEP